MRIETQLCAGSAADVWVDLEVHDSANRKVGQLLFGGLFAAGEHQFFGSFFQASDLLPGVYTVKVGVFSTDWSTLLSWDNQAATFTVVAVGPCPEEITIGPTVATPTVAGAGQRVQVTTWVCSPSALAAGGLWEDLEIYDPHGVKIAHSILPFNPEFEAPGGGLIGFGPLGTSYEVPTPPLRGTYTVKVGVFSHDWSTLYRWDNRAATFTVQ